MIVVLLIVAVVLLVALVVLALRNEKRVATTAYDYATGGHHVDRTSFDRKRIGA